MSFDDKLILDEVLLDLYHVEGFSTTRIDGNYYTHWSIKICSTMLLRFSIIDQNGMPPPTSSIVQTSSMMSMLSLCLVFNYPPIFGGVGDSNSTPSDGFRPSTNTGSDNLATLQLSRTPGQSPVRGPSVEGKRGGLLNLSIRTLPEDHIVGARRAVETSQNAAHTAIVWTAATL